jgi:two-component system chemotaxis sensor kinase CheA
MSQIDKSGARSTADRHAQVFREEAAELLAEMETALLELEESPEDLDLVDRVFRAMHTIKGSGAMFGFDDIAAFAHHLETILDRVRDGDLSISKDLIDLTLASCDQIKAMLAAADGGPAADLNEAARIIAGLEAIAAAADGGDCAKDTEPAPGEANREVTYHIRFRPNPEVFVSGMDPALLLDELRELGECTVVPQTEDIPTLDELNVERCYLFWDVILTTDRGTNEIQDVFIFVQDDSSIEINEIADGSDLSAQLPPRLGEILVERGDATPAVIRQALEQQKPIGELLVESGLVSRDKVESALCTQEVLNRRSAAAKVASVRVPADKLDKLINLVGELVTTQARLSQVATRVDDAELASPVEDVERLTEELRDCVLNIRMLPIGTTFSKFRRLVRDLSAKLGKEVELVTEGAETELDKTVIERLDDPLVHLIRNCVDHGIEPPDMRESAGKPRRGTVLLSAVHSGANVLIRIKDDGAGLDPETIRAKAVAKGLIGPEAELSEKELFELIFAPGFSTAEKVTDVSGRGVGMDVVKRNIEDLGGSIDIGSQKGAGTTVTIKLPLTLAIIEGLQVAVGGDCYVLPLSVVEECVELTREDAARANGRHVANVRGEIVPYIRLRDWFVFPGETPSIEYVVIARVDGRRIGLVVDQIIGEHQTVIKPLGSLYRKVSAISGATIRGDGTVALIIDIPRLVQSVETEEATTTRELVN